jgi:hypothetical protein
VLREDNPHREEEMEDHEEMEEDSNSNVPMLAPRGTFIPDTKDGTVTGARHSAKRHRVVVRVNLSSDNLTLLVFMHEALHFLRQIRALKIVQETVGVL